jgi:hypothetical protein
MALVLGAAGCSTRERPKSGEFVVDRYKSTGYLLLSFPTASHALYQKMQSDPERVRRLLYP